MPVCIELDPSKLKEARTVDERLVSYNVEMTEVTGGTFWKPYTPGQIAGTEEFPQIKSFADFSFEGANTLMEEFPPANLYNERLRKLAKEIGPAWVRVSGSWATDTYYDFDGTCQDGKAPEGFRAVLTRDMWVGVLDFVKAIGAKLMISVANCPGTHDGDGPWKSDQAKVIFDFSRDYGVPIEAAEFMNEPNMVSTVKIPGYGVKEYARDQDLFARFIRENYPECQVVACSACGDDVQVDGKSAGVSGVSDMMKQFGMEVFDTDDLIKIAEEAPDVFSYHYYNGISERLAVLGVHWDADKTLSEEYLVAASASANYYAKRRDTWAPGAQMWVTESGDAGGGGDTWASTYMDVFRTLNELGTFSAITDGVIFHNTLSSSDYGYLDRKTHLPRPNWWAVVLWNRIMGQKVYETAPVQEGAHVFVHDRADGKDGYAALVINNSKTDATTVKLPKDAEVYVLSADTLRAQTMKLNGHDLVLGENDEVPAMDPVSVPAGDLVVEPATMAFIVL